MVSTRPFIASVAAAALISLALGQARAAGGCEMHMVASIPAKLSARNQLLVAATIDDTPVAIQIDTGAQSSLLSKKFALRMGMPIDDAPSEVYGLTGEALT